MKTRLVIALVLVLSLTAVLHGCKDRLSPEQLGAVRSAAREALAAAPESLTWEADAATAQAYAEGRRTLQSLDALEPDAAALAEAAERIYRAATTVESAIVADFSGLEIEPGLLPDAQYRKLQALVRYYECKNECQRLIDWGYDPVGGWIGFVRGWICDFSCTEKYGVVP